MSTSNESKNNFCILPFYHLNIDYDGRIKACCKILESAHIDNFELKSAFESDYLSQLRKAFVENERPAACNRCWQDEAAGVLSYRQKHTARLSDRTAELVAKPSLLSLDTAFGNICNAKCVTCESVSSDLWVEDELALNSKMSSEFQRKIRPKLNFEPLFSPEILDPLEVINLTQSEALVQKGFYNVINVVKENSIDCSQKTIKLSTNGGVKPNSQVIEFLSGFQAVDLQFSVDGIGEMFNYLRFPLRWEKVEENVLYWLSLFSEKPNTSIRCRYTASALNLSQFLPVMQWWDEISCGIKAKNNFNIGVVASPEYLSPELAGDWERYATEISRYIPRWLPEKTLDDARVAFLKAELQKFKNTLESQRGNQFPNFGRVESRGKVAFDFPISRT